MSGYNYRQKGRRITLSNRIVSEYVKVCKRHVVVSQEVNRLSREAATRAIGLPLHEQDDRTLLHDTAHAHHKLFLRLHGLLNCVTVGLCNLAEMFVDQLSHARSIHSTDPTEKIVSLKSRMRKLTSSSWAIQGLPGEG